MSEQDNSPTDLNEIDLDAVDDLAELEKILMKVNIAHTLASIEKMRQDNDRANQDSEVERTKNAIDVARMQADTVKIQAETTKIQKEMRYYPLMTTGGAAIIVFILNFVAKKLGLM